MFNLKSSRPGRRPRRPDLDALESRQLLTMVPAIPSGATGAIVRGDGTINQDAMIQASAARVAYDVDGSGGNVAVIDTGVDYRNPAFGSGAVGSATNKVVAAVDFTGSPNGVIPTWQHGTGVAGLIASTNPSDPGVAPGAGIVALRVFGDNNQGSFASIAAALDWVVQNHAKYDITAVNLSVSDNGNYTSNVFSNDGGVGQQITGSVGTLDRLNIPVVVATGNAFDGKAQGEGFASIIPQTISVTATDETRMSNGADPLAADAQRLGSARGGASATDIAAPGVSLTAASGPSGTATEEGTSFATPQVTGTILLLQQMYRQAHGTLPTVDQLDGWLKAGADPIHDAATGIDIGRLDVMGSLRVLAGQISPVTPAVIAPPSVANPVLDSQVVSSPNTTPSTATTSPDAPSTVATETSSAAPSPSVPPTQAATSDATGPATVGPMTEVFVNGSSVGSVATSQLASGFARLFALTGGSAKSLRAWAPAGSVVDLGAVQPSGSVISAATVGGSSAGKRTHPTHLGHATPRSGHHKLGPAAAARAARAVAR